MQVNACMSSDANDEIARSEITPQFDVQAAASKQAADEGSIFSAEMRRACCDRYLDDKTGQHCASRLHRTPAPSPLPPRRSFRPAN